MRATDVEPTDGHPSRRTSAQTGRRGAAGRRAGRPDTRAEILAAALSLFAERGYAGTSIRAVAAGAGVDPALVHHYFGTKEGLFRATLGTPIDPDELVARIVTGDAEGAPRRLVETFFAVWDSPETGPAMVSFLRRVLADQASATLFRDFMGATLLRTLAEELVEGPDHRAAATRVQLAASQLIGLVIIRKVVGMEPLASLTTAQLTDAVTPSIAHYLQGESAELDLGNVVTPSRAARRSTTP